MMTRAGAGAGAGAGAEAPHKATVKEKKSLVIQAYEYVVGGSSDESHTSAHMKQRLSLLLMKTKMIPSKKI